jgi:hypothetical protein
MSTSNDYSGIAARLVRTPERPFFSATFLSPKAAVTTTFDRELETPSLVVNLDLDAASFKISAPQGKEKGPNVIIRPNLKPFDANLEYYPFKNGNFKLTGAVPVSTFGKVSFTYGCEDASLTTQVNGSLIAGGAKITGDAVFPGVFTPSAINISVTAGNITAKLSGPHKNQPNLSLFFAGAPLSFGATTGFGSPDFMNPKIYAKYVYGDAAIAAILSLPSENKFAIELRVKKGCCPATRPGIHGFVLSFADRKPALSVGGKVRCQESGKTIAYQISSAGALGVKGSAKVDQWNAKFSIAGRWTALAFDAAALKPNIAFGVKLGSK